MVVPVVRPSRSPKDLTQIRPAERPGMTLSCSGALFLRRLGRHRRCSKAAEIAGPDTRPERAPGLRRTAERRMHDRLLGAEAKAPEKRDIVREHIAVVH